jgi:hypothetical protein
MKNNRPTARMKMANNQAAAFVFLVIGIPSRLSTNGNEKHPKEKQSNPKCSPKVLFTIAKHFAPL